MKTMPRTILERTVFASAPRGADDAYRLADRLRGRGRASPRRKRTRGKAAELRRLLSSMASSVDVEGRFLRAVGSVPVAELLVSPAMISAAGNAAVQAASELGTTEPEVRWFKTIRGGKPARGWFDPAMSDVIWISASLGVSEVPSVVAHESKHRDDYLAGRPITEKSARRFAARYEPPSDPRMYAPRPTDFFSPPLIGA